MCARHRTDGMLPYSNRRCRVAKCREVAVFGTIKRQLHCEAHAVAGEVNIVERKCTSCGLLNIISPTSRQCGYCDPTFKTRRPVKWKELDIKGCLEAAGYTLVHDRAVGAECGLRDRPDFVIDIGHYLIIIEVDEHQHGGYRCVMICTCHGPNEAAHCQCQQARMMDLGQALGKPQIYMRFNPDSYMTACGTRGREGPARRKQELLRHVKHLVDRGAPIAYTSCIYLYYDGDDQTERVLVPFA
jgi:hypothetical protein